MHERSLVKSLLKQVEQLAARHGGSEVEKVTVELGPLSGVEIDLVEIAFAELAGSTELAVNRIPLCIECLRCRQSSELEDYVFRCSHCGSGNVRVTSGDQFRLLSIELAEGVSDAH